jgi:serine phosphatase RsbU (regulator of sigma subunit)
LRTFFIFLLFLFLLSDVATVFGNIRTAPPKAVNGKLDLGKWNLSKDGVVPLNGEWEFYWRNLLSPGDFRQGNLNPADKSRIVIPGFWNGQKRDMKAWEVNGYGTFRLSVTPVDPRRIMGLKLPIVSTSYRLWVNGTLLAECGKVGTNRAGTVFEGLPKTVSFTPGSNALEIILQVANFHDRDGGIGDEILLGTHEQITELREKAIALELCIFGILFIIGIYNMMLFLLWKKDLSPLYFGIFCILLAFRSVFDGENYFLSIMPWIGSAVIMKAWFLTYYLCVPSFVGYFFSIFPGEFHRRAVQALAVIAIVFSAIVVVFPLEIYVHMLNFYHVVVFAGIGYSIYGLVLALSRKRSGAETVIVGAAILILSTVNDVLYGQYLINTAYITPYCFIVFIFSQAVLISAKFSRSFSKIETLSREIAQKNTQLTEYNTQLERNVAERTTELVAERDLLKARNLIIEKDLNLARRMQSQLLPKEAPENIRYFYRAMDQVGGDFFDFVNFPGKKDLLGIFISDVSGHGVAAAFVTSMIKTSLNQVASVVSDPAFVMQMLNDNLHAQTDGNFITAFYAIYNQKTRVLQYSNAGHNLPYLIVNGALRQIPSGMSSIPLGILNLEEMEAADKLYRNATLVLPEHSRLLLYTDGMSEAINELETSEMEDIPDFEAAKLEEIVQQNQGLPVKQFLDHLVDGLVKFHRSERFEDDVCIICLDV